MAPSVSADIDIAAPPKAVWAVLTDYDRYPQWNPFVTKLSGEKEGWSYRIMEPEKLDTKAFQTVGGKLTVTINPPNGTDNGKNSV